METTKNLNKAADNIRILAAAMVEKPNQDTLEEPWEELTLPMFSMPNIWYMTPTMRHGLIETASSSIQDTCHPCSMVYWHVLANSPWTN